MADDALPPSPPEERPSSPASWVSPSLAISAVPGLDRSVSTASSVSSRPSSEGGLPGRRRGYMRPQATVFAESAKHRESVMNLGTIAHLQYYFARTGLLDGKGAQLAKSRKTSSHRSASGSDMPPSALANAISYLSVDKPDEAPLVDSLVESPIDESGWDDQEPMMLPPTVSTYKETPVYVPPPPDMDVLRRELREAVADALKLVEGLEASLAKAAGSSASAAPTETQGWFEIQGLNILDVVTLAIRAAKNYYTAHEEPQRLYALKSERKIRAELFQTLDVLRRLAARNFANGIQSNEATSIANWLRGIRALLVSEEEREGAEEAERSALGWLDGDWTGRERERERLFLRSFDADDEPLPEWTEPTGALPTPFLAKLRTGLRLVQLHNAMVRRSRRQFEEIKHFHTDTAKPYRCADNLRYWAKAAQLRWDVALDVDVMGIVHGDEAAWRRFDEALLRWCRGVRGEITADWRQPKQRGKAPLLTIDGGLEH